VCVWFIRLIKRRTVRHTATRPQNTNYAIIAELREASF